MSKKYSFWLFFLLCVLPLNTSFGLNPGEVYVINEEIPDNGVDLIGHVQILKDSSDLKISDLINATEYFDTKKQYKQPIDPNYSYWGVVYVSNHLDHTVNVVLSVGENNFATFYNVQNGRVIDQGQGGELVKVSDKRITTGRKESLFELQVLSGDTLSVFFKLKNITHFPPEISPRLYNQNSWFQTVNKRTLIQGLYQGFLWFLICYSLAFYIKIRDTTYLYFALYVLSFALYFSWFGGLLHEYFLPETPFLNIYLWLISGLSPVFYLLFLRGFLHTKKMIPRWDKWIKIMVKTDLVVFSIAALWFHFTFNRPQAVLIINNMVLVNLIIGFFLLYILFKTKNVLTYYFIGGSLIFILSSFLGIVVYEYFEYQNAAYYVLTGNAIELTIFSLGLAKRVELLRKSKNEADAKLIAQLKENELLQEEIKSALANTIDEQGGQLSQKNKELNQAVEKLKAINGELQSFAYTVAHDLKAPLRAVNYFASFIGEDQQYPLKNEDNENLEMLKLQVKKMDQLIQGVLKYSIAASLVQDLKQIDLNVMMDELVQLLPSTSKAKIEYNDLPIIVGDEVKIHQVFQNLISNALKFTNPDNGLIEVGYEDRCEHWMFWVKDNGEGIAPEHFERIFVIFKTVEDTSKSESSGIGLAIVKKIVELHGGNVWVESELGKGTTFYFNISQNPNE